MKLTVHLQDAPMIKREQKNIGTKEAPTMKPKKANCIMNTITRKGLKTQKEVNDALSYIRKHHVIAIWESGDKAGKEMIYISHER